MRVKLWYEFQMNVSGSNFFIKFFQKIPGVAAFFSAKDIPGTNNFAPLKATLIFETEEIFCSSDVKFYGQPVGIILASTHELANKAAEIVEVKYEGTLRNVYERNMKFSLILCAIRIFWSLFQEVFVNILNKGRRGMRWKGKIFEQS